MKVFYWPDGCWVCEEKDLREMLGHRSDDIGVIELDDADHHEDWQIDMMVRERLG